MARDRIDPTNLVSEGNLNMKLGRRRCASGNAARTEMVVSEGAITPAFCTLLTS
jgi:hypothetical protein